MAIKKILTSLALYSVSITSFATIEGTDITTHRAYPTVNDNYSVSPITTTVVAGDSDIFAFQYSYVDIEPNQIKIDFGNSAGFVGDLPTFDGYVFRGFNGQLTNAQLVSSDINTTIVTYDDSNIYVNFSGFATSSSNVIISFDAGGALPPSINGSIDTGKITEIFTSNLGHVAISLDSNFINAVNNSECPTAYLWAGDENLNSNMFDTILLAKKLNATVEVTTNGCIDNWLKITSIELK